MEENNHHHPSRCDTDSFPGFQPWNTRGFVDVKKKRKLLIEQLSLPTPKLPCWGPRSTSFDPYGDNFKFNKNHPQEEEEEKVKSNLTKMAIEVEILSKEDQVGMQGKRDDIKDEMQKSYGHEEDLLEFGSHVHSSIDIDEQCCSHSTDQSLLLPKDSNHEFVLSSGRWSMDPEAEESKTIKPTIDQEFEQYFSVLL